MTTAPVAADALNAHREDLVRRDDKVIGEAVDAAQAAAKLRKALDLVDRHLDVTAGLVSKWERGEKHPAGPSLKLLSLVRSKGLDAIV